MKKILTFILLVLVCGSLPAFSQKKEKNRDDMRKEIFEYKLKFLAQEMDLKDDQQQKFFDLYTKMENEKHALFKEAKRAENKVKEKNPTEEDYAAAAEMSASVKLKEAQIEEKYNEKFKTFLSSKQMFKMKEAEDTFRSKLREMRKQKKK